ncbi:hypothetical protein V8F33_005330 [Rhypophila sp. PSN 637]
MCGLFSRQPVVEHCPTDRVVPLHFFENSLLVQGNNMAVPLVFDEVLDPQKIRDALEGLVKRDGWQRLGGRLKKNPSTGKIEWHIPTTFTPERTPLNYSHVSHDIASSAHPAASKIPQASSRPSVVCDPDDLAPLAWEEGYSPAGISDYVDTDKPVLGLRIHSFTDRTIVVLQWQHVAFDALGLQCVVENWARMLRGQESSIPTPCGLESDPFAPLADGSRRNEKSEQHVLVSKKAGLGGMLKWGLGYGVDMLVRAKENRMVCIPQSYWQPQLKQALAELRAEATALGEDPDKVFLTENDVVTAWVLRSVVLPQNMPAERTVAASIAMSLRKAFIGDLIPDPETSPYVGNAFGWANVLVTAGDVASKPLSWLAKQVRKAINEQGTKAQHEAYYEMVRTSGTPLPIVIFGDGGMAQVGFSNWDKAGLFKLDFSPARVGKGEGTCMPVYVQENHGPVKPADGFFVFGKDGRGNYWTSAYKVKGQWGKLQEMLEKNEF